MNYSDYLVPIEFNETKDYIGLPSTKDLQSAYKIKVKPLEKLHDSRLKSQATDYAMLNNPECNLHEDPETENSSMRSTPPIAKSMDMDYYVIDKGVANHAIAMRDGCVQPADYCDNSFGRRLKINIKYDKTIKSLIKKIDNLEYIDFGYFAKSMCDEELSNVLEYAYENGKLKKVGRWIGSVKNGNFLFNEEFVHKKKRYVRTIENKSNLAYWCNVEPITWIVDRTHKDRGILVLISRDVLFSGVPYQFLEDDPLSEHQYHSEWQNSFDRALLNGYNLHEEINKGNGLPQKKTKENISVKKCLSFMHCFDYPISVAKEPEPEQEM